MCNAQSKFRGFNSLVLQGSKMSEFIPTPFLLIIRIHAV